MKWSTWCQSFPGTERPFWTPWKRLDAALSLMKLPTPEDLGQRLLHLFRWNCMHWPEMKNEKPSCIGHGWKMKNHHLLWIVSSVIIFYDKLALTLWSSGVNVVMYPRLWRWHLLVTSLVIALHLISIYWMAPTFLRQKTFSCFPRENFPSKFTWLFQYFESRSLKKSPP